ncbi:D123-domain-containing protein, partial [Cyathus striatus]
MSESSVTLFPAQTPSYILAFQFSSWYADFATHSIKSTVIRPLSEEFKEYLNSDGVFIPQGSDDIPAESTLSDDEDDSDSDGEPPKQYSFPELDQQIRECIKEYGAVFPKLNFTSPRDAAWVLPASSPLKCTTPADVYMLLKSSDYVNHDLNLDFVFEGCDLESIPESQSPKYELELVLRKWHPVDRGRELRCFVRGNRLIGITQRDTNYYDYLNEVGTKDNIISTVQTFWEKHIKSKWEHIESYTFDFLLTRDLSRGHILDFNPFAPKTDSMLFTYEELRDVYVSEDSRPQFSVIDSRSHPAATAKAPAHQQNMVPFEAVSLSSGRDIEDFAEQWKETIKESMVGSKIKES